MSGAHVSSSDQIIWNWNAVTGANGYKWNSTSDYVTATDLGTTTTKTETGLTCSTTYTRYVWAYNNCGVSSFTVLTDTTLWCCGKSLNDSRDSKTYNTALIGSQCWMAQNLNIGTMIPGSSEQTNHNSIEKYCYNNEEANCTVYGGLYKWDNAMQWSTNEGVQGICPIGWHIPADGEWTVLTTFLGGEGIAGGKMKETGYVHWASPNGGATNISDFTALPGGGRHENGSFYYLTFNGSFWSSSQSVSSSAWQRALDCIGEYIVRNNSLKFYGWSVRCLKD